jgi:hypothetical protein
MPRQQFLNFELKETILSVVSGTPDRARVNSLVEVCRALASSFLSGKASAGTLASFHGISVNDLAYDCIADLFRQDEKGNYLELQSYFNGLEIEKLDGDILPHLRRLVFSKVNQGIYRLYSETDPSLSRILRNVKLAIGALRNFTEAERFGETHIAPSLTDTLEHLPPFDREELERQFLAVTTGNELVPQLLAKLSRLLRDQDECSRVVPLISVGLMIRKAYDEKKAVPVEADATETAMGMKDVITTIRDACNDVRQNIRAKYVDCGKVNDSVFCCYFKAIEAELLNRVRGKEGSEQTLFTALRKFLPDLCKEYLLKLVGERVSARIQHE